MAIEEERADLDGVVSRVGERLYQLRKASGLSQELLGQRLGISGAAISHYESGRSQIDADALHLFADALGIDPCVFLTTDEAAVEETRVQLFRRGMKAPIPLEQLDLFTDYALRYRLEATTDLMPAGVA